jgi:hypothetical protein
LGFIEEIVGGGVGEKNAWGFSSMMCSGCLLVDFDDLMFILS